MKTHVEASPVVEPVLYIEPYPLAYPVPETAAEHLYFIEAGNSIPKP